jgi:hypothetical protein
MKKLIFPKFYLNLPFRSRRRGENHGFGSIMIPKQFPRIRIRYYFRTKILPLNTLPVLFILELARKQILLKKKYKIWFKRLIHNRSGNF